MPKVLLKSGQVVEIPFEELKEFLFANHKRMNPIAAQYIGARRIEDIDVDVRNIETRSANIEK